MFRVWCIGLFLLFGLLAALSDLSGHGLSLTHSQTTVVLWVVGPFLAALALCAAYTLLATRPLLFIGAVLLIYLLSTI
jgi:hypothetical protein